jgi:hypothetical protein
LQPESQGLARCDGLGFFAPGAFRLYHAAEKVMRELDPANPPCAIFVTEHASIAGVKRFNVTQFALYILDRRCR